MGLLQSLWTGNRCHPLGMGGWRTLNAGLFFLACPGAPGFLLCPLSAKKGAGEAERTGNYPDWNDCVVPEKPCLAPH